MENVFEIHDGILERCTVVKPDVVIPDGVKVVKYTAFKVHDSYRGTKKLKSVVIPESVETIEAGAFQYCERLRKVTILGPADIGDEAFLSCDSLEDVYLADGVKSIGNECFAYCEKIEYLYIPKSVVEIGYDIARMNDASYRDPVFKCYAKGKGLDWSDDWNRTYNDPRFGDDRSHHFFHPTFYGIDRNGKPRQESPRVAVTDMPHGTGVPATKSKSRAESHRIPQTRLRLWLTATLKSMVGDNEYALDDEEREMLPRVLRDYHSSTEHPLDEPWEIILDDEHYSLTPELIFNVYIDRHTDHYDGKHLIVHHDMPFHNDPYKSYPVSTLVEGGTIIAEREVYDNLTIYDVRLHIQWPKQETEYHTLDEARLLIQNDRQLASYTDENNELDVLLAHSHWRAEKYKTYKPSEFPQQFFDDLKAEGDKWSDLGQIVIQPYELYEVTHSYSDDYKDAAMAYGADCDDWTTTERRKTGTRLAYEIKN